MKMLSGLPTQAEPEEQAGWTGRSTREFEPGELADDDPNHESNQDPGAEQDHARLALALAGPEAQAARMHTTMCQVCKAAEQLRPDQFCGVGFILSEAVPKPARYRCRCPACVRRRVVMGLPAVG